MSVHLIISFVLGTAFGGCAVSSWWCFHLAGKLRHLHESDQVLAEAIFALERKRNAS